MNTTAHPTPPLLSVVIPCFNRAEYLRPTIDSVLAQDYPNIECVVVDGGSKDGTVDILKSYGGRIRWVSEPDKGHADAINKGWRMCHGQVLAWLNADDLWVTPDAAGAAMRYLEDHPDVDLVYGDCYEVDPSGRRVGWTYLRQWDLAYAVENCDHCIPQPAAFIRRRILDKVGLLDTRFYQKKDHEFWLRIALQGKIAYLPQPLACERNIKGLSFDGRTAAPACVQLTNHFYNLPGVPQHLYARKPRAVSNSYLRGADYAFAGGPLWGIIFEYTLRAIITDPTNAAQAINRLAHHLRRGAASNHFVWLLVVFGSILSIPVRVVRDAVDYISKLSAPAHPQACNDPAAADAVTRDWVIARLPGTPAKTLIYEQRESNLPLVAAMRGCEVLATAPSHTPWPYTHHQLRFTRDQFVSLVRPDDHYDLIVSRSTAGLQDNGTADRLARSRHWLKPGGQLLLTMAAPAGSADPASRGMFDGFEIVEQTTWQPDDRNRWAPVAPKTNPDTGPKAAASIRCYALRKK